MVYIDWKHHKTTESSVLTKWFQPVRLDFHRAKSWKIMIFHYFHWFWPFRVIFHEIHDFLWFPIIFSGMKKYFWQKIFFEMYYINRKHHKTTESSVLTKWFQPVRPDIHIAESWKTMIFWHFHRFWHFWTFSWISWFLVISHPLQGYEKIFLTKNIFWNVLYQPKTS